MSKPAPSFFTDSFFFTASLERDDVSPVHGAHLPSPRCCGEGAAGPSCPRRHASDDPEGYNPPLKSFFWKHFSKVEEVFLRLNQIYIGSVVDDYGIQFQVKKVFSSMMVHP